MASGFSIIVKAPRRLPSAPLREKGKRVVRE